MRDHEELDVGTGNSWIQFILEKYELTHLGKINPKHRMRQHSMGQGGDGNPQGSRKGQPGAHLGTFSDFFGVVLVRGAEGWRHRPLGIPSPVFGNRVFASYLAGQWPGGPGRGACHP